MNRQPHDGPATGNDAGVAGAAQARERAIARLARRQHGVVSRTQLRRAGLSEAAIDERVKSGRLRAIRRGIYLIGPLTPPLAREMAAVLACGPGAVLSHRSAAALWRLLPERTGRRDPDLTESRDLEVTVPGRQADHKPGIRVHRVRTLEANETTTFKGIPTTTPARTLLDITAELGGRELEAALAEAERRRLTTRRHLLALVARYPRRRGIPALRDLVERNEQPALTRSEAEERFLALVRTAELPNPDVNVPVGGYEVDFLWRDERLIVEVDGYAHHSDRDAFERDRRRDAELVALGHVVVRITWRQIVDAPTAVVARVAQGLARAGSR